MDFTKDWNNEPFANPALIRFSNRHWFCHFCVFIYFLCVSFKCIYVAIHFEFNRYVKEKRLEFNFTHYFTIESIRCVIWLYTYKYAISRVKTKATLPALLRLSVHFMIVCWASAVMMYVCVYMPIHRNIIISITTPSAKDILHSTYHPER